MPMDFPGTGSASQGRMTTDRVLCILPPPGGLAGASKDHRVVLPQERSTGTDLSC